MYIQDICIALQKDRLVSRYRHRAYGGGRVQEGYSRPPAGGSTRRNGAFRRNAKNVADRLTSDLFSDIMAERLCKEFWALQSGLMPHTVTSDIYFFYPKTKLTGYFVRQLNVFHNQDQKLF